MKKLLSIFKKYSLILFVLISLGYSASVLWTFYNDIYTPIALETTPPVQSVRFRAPNVDAFFAEDDEESDLNIYTFSNPFKDISQIDEEPEQTIDPDVIGDTET